MSHQYGFERVYVESEWYDGPRSGIADIHGVPHRFKSNFDEHDDEWLGTFVVFPIEPDLLALEQEQWRIFVAWNKRHEADCQDTSTHPGHGGIDQRWDELEVLLAESRNTYPADVRSAKAEFLRLDREERYDDDGPDYRLSWKVL